MANVEQLDARASELRWTLDESVASIGCLQLCLLPMFLFHWFVTVLLHPLSSNPQLQVYS